MLIRRGKPKLVRRRTLPAPKRYKQILIASGEWQARIDENVEGAHMEVWEDKGREKRLFPPSDYPSFYEGIAAALCVMGNHGTHKVETIWGGLQEEADDGE